MQKNLKFPEKYHTDIMDDAQTRNPKVICDCQTNVLKFHLLLRTTARHVLHYFPWTYFFPQKNITDLYSLANKLELVAKGCTVKCVLAELFMYFQAVLIDTCNYGKGLCCHTAMTFCPPAQW